MLIDKQLEGWIRGNDRWSTLRKTPNNNEMEYEFACSYLKPTSRKQWTNKFGEELVKSLLQLQGHSIYKARKIGGLQPDIETETAFYEVKTRNWTTNGTVGEKILGAPHKYINFSRYTSKKLYIVLVGYQEWEARYKFNLFANDSRVLKLLELYKQWNIEFIPASSFLRCP